MFFTRQTKIPDIGPIVREAITAGKSEKSKDKKLGTRGILKLNIISTAATAASIAVNTSFLVSKSAFTVLFLLVSFIKIILSEGSAISLLCLLTIEIKILSSVEG